MNSEMWRPVVNSEMWHPVVGDAVVESVEYSVCYGGSSCRPHPPVLYIKTVTMSAKYDPQRVTYQETGACPACAAQESTE